MPRKSINNIKLGRKPKTIFKPKHRPTIHNVVVAGVALKELELCDVMYLGGFCRQAPTHVNAARRAEIRLRLKTKKGEWSMSSSKGNAGEHLVMAELLMQDFEAYWADRGNPDFDVSCVWKPSQRKTRLRVKTASDGNAVWTAKKKTGLLFGQIQPEDDMVVICDLTKGIRGAEFYICRRR